VWMRKGEFRDQAVFCLVADIVTTICMLAVIFRVLGIYIVIASAFGHTMVCINSSCFKF